MTILQKLQLKQSEIRERLAALLGKADKTDEERAELRTLTTRAQEIETEIRAAMILDVDPEENRIERRETQEELELRQLQEGVRLGAYLQRVTENRVLDGREAELNQQLGLGDNDVPFAAIAPPPVERRERIADIETRAVTPAPGDVGATQAAILGRVFASTAAQFLGVRMESVGVGERNYPVLSTGAAPSTLAKDAEKDQTTGAFRAFVLDPRRLQASFLFRREDAAVLRGLETALRMDLSGSLSEELDRAVLTGDGVAPNVGGFLVGGLSAPSAPGSTAKWGDYARAVPNQVDGRYAMRSASVRGVFGKETFRHASGIFTTGGPNESAMEYLERISGGVRVSAHVPAVASKAQDAVLARGMGGAVAPIWEGVTLIRDEVTQAAKGQIVLTAVSLYSFRILRTEQFARIRFQVQD